MEKLARKAARGEIERGPQHRPVNGAITAIRVKVLGMDPEKIAADTNEHLSEKEVRWLIREISQCEEWLAAYRSQAALKSEADGVVTKLREGQREND